LALAVILLSCCATRGQLQKTSAGPASELEKKAAAADAFMKKGCYADFKKALEIYSQLYAQPSVSKAITVPYLKALILMAVRERDLGILNDGTLGKAHDILRRHPSLSYFVPYVQLASHMPLKARGIIEDTDVMRTVNIVNRTLKDAGVMADMRGKALADEDLAYLYLVFCTSYANYLNQREDLSVVTRLYPDSMLFKYAAATTYPRQDPTALRALAQAEPDFYEAYYSLGELALGVDKPPDIDLELLSSVRAENYFLKALEGVPESAQIMIYLGGICITTEEFHKALDDFDKALALVPTYRDATLGKAICLSSLGRRREAIEILNGLINAGTYLMGESYYWLARNYHELKDMDKAELSIEESKGRLPTDSEVCGLAGTLALETNKLDKAESEFIESLRYNGRNINSVLGLAEVYAKQLKWLDSAAFYAHAIKAIGQRETELAEIMKRIEGSKLDPERKAKIFAKKEQQRRVLEENEAAAYYQAAVGYSNGGQRAQALEMAAKAAAYPQFKEAAEKLMSRIQ
jgi:hypothetical protein